MTFVFDTCGNCKRGSKSKSNPICMECQQTEEVTGKAFQKHTPKEEKK